MMARVWVSGIAAAVFLFVFQAGNFAQAQQVGSPASAKPVGPDAMQLAPTIPPQVYRWDGLYAGMNLGAAWGAYDPTTTTSIIPHVGYLLHPADIAAVNKAGAQAINPVGFAGGGQIGYNLQFGRTLLGIEGEADYLHLLGAANSGAIRYPAGGSGFFNGAFRLNQFVVSSYADADWLMTLRPRLGVTANNWLFYVTGGLALTKVQGQLLFTDGNARGAVLGAFQEANIDAFRAGYAIGGGVETGLTDRLSVKAEYLRVQFGDIVGHQVSSNFLSGFTPPSPQNFTQSMKLSANLVRLGLNYRFGDVGPPAAGGGGALWDSAANPFLPATPSNWEFDAGSRFWFSSGKIGAPQPLLGFGPAPSQLISRLTYTDLNAYSGETFARADHASGFFIKGFVGAGGITRGNLIDEDFPGFGGAYSSTTSPVSGHLGYATIDLGYTFLKAPGAKLGAFVGYNYYTQHLNGFGCNQAAGDTTCVGLDPNFQVFAEDDHFNSLRLGLVSDFWLTNQLKFSAEAAYLPWTEFSGQDDHNFRELLFPESAATGNGVMLESILSYALTSNWNIGAGGRYWAWNSHTGNEWFDALGLPPPTQPQLGRFSTERYGFFLQTDYHWGGAAMDDAALAAKRSRAAITTAAANWTGFYLGGYLGGGWSGDRWSDPFSSTISSGLVNVAGFGDTVHSTGPLGGGQIGADWQTGPWVVGVDAELGAANLRGENTCFSGLGGLDCQHYVDAVGIAAARFGYAFGQSLIYAKGGAARVSSTYAILGNTAGNTLGFETVDKAATGWMAGAGIQYAFSGNWSTDFEYEHIGVGSVIVPFPAVALINTQTIGVKQSLDLLKLGVNYKFDWAAPFNTGG
jgi:opacity protein-like surface antigen